MTAVASPRTGGGIRLDGLAKAFRGPHGPIHAVRGIDVSIAAGETAGLLGPNGAGKSTTIDMLLGRQTGPAATIFAVGHPETYRTLVLDGDWSEDRWARWAQTALETALIPVQTDPPAADTTVPPPG